MLRDKVVLVVDDWEVDRIRVVERLKAELDARFVTACDGMEALEVIERDKPDLVITDLMMPRMDGLRLVECIRKRYTFLPAVLVTSRGSEEIAMQALMAGAVQYVPKQELDRLPDTVIRVLDLSIGYRQQERLRTYWNHTESEFLLDNEEAAVSVLVSHLQQQSASMRGLDDTETFRLGVALHEALRNAIQHGNLELSSELRESESAHAGGKLADFDRLFEERRHRTPYCDRRVRVAVRETPGGGHYTIQDEGPGFDRRLLEADPRIPGNVARSSGRGLFLIHTFMHDVTFNESGNTITMVHRYCPSDRHDDRSEDVEVDGCAAWASAEDSGTDEQQPG